MSLPRLAGGVSDRRARLVMPVNIVMQDITCSYGNHDVRLRHCDVHYHVLLPCGAKRELHFRTIAAWDVP